MVNLSLSKEELDVVYYALKSFAVDKRLNVDVMQRASLITNSKLSGFVESQLRASTIADKLCDDCIKLMLDMLKH